MEGGQGKDGQCVAQEGGGEDCFERGWRAAAAATKRGLVDGGGRGYGEGSPPKQSRRSVGFVVSTVELIDGVEVIDGVAFDESDLLHL
ncbi:hypothetical protein LTR91_017069 [Friedmanniomyces endolithicus]|uniref:Uncharacterized protein n=1 Tax=Friedmanniomyces endolithicus TaxID=329885 RepID=A0AAN6K6V9_9PEZI|nr:hypothetical protein LTR03_001287 [Friedmanniomyces endolithicus]KAK0967593.1 hypothetical protein LTR91_017069 [Friedmanniomyces endolithicus]